MHESSLATCLLAHERECVAFFRHATKLYHVYLFYQIPTDAITHSLAVIEIHVLL